jgi:Uma2 family endonuclease
MTVRQRAQDTSPSVGRRMSLGEFLRLPEQEPALEYEDGLVTQKVSPKRRHARGGAKLAEALIRTGEDTGIGEVYVEGRFLTPDWAPVPDISFYTRERLDRQGEDAEDFTVAPDIAVEISSPDQGQGELVRKSQRYLTVGVRIAVLVTIEVRTVFVSRPGRPLAVLRGADRIDLGEVLPAFDLTADGLFAMIRPARSARPERQAGGPADGSTD